MVSADVCAVPVQLTTLVSSAPLSFSPGTSHYDIKTVATKAIVDGTAHVGLACNVSTNGAEFLHYDPCTQFISISDVPDNVTVIVYNPTDAPSIVATYYIYIATEAFSDKTRVISITAAGLVVFCLFPCMNICF
jgi:hypothetical protein